MIKELMLLPRTLYGVIFTLLGLYAIFTSPWHPRTFIGSFLFLFAFSFVWQYYVLHSTMRMLDKNPRLILLAVWLVLSFIIGAWGLNLLTNFDWFQDESTLMNDFAWRMTVYLIGASMFVGGTCTRRAYTKHGAL